MIPRYGQIPATARIRFTSRKAPLFIALLLVRFCSDLGAASFEPWRTPSARELGAEVSREHIRTRFGSSRSHRGKTVSKLFVLELLGLLLSKKQIPQIVETIRNVEN